MIVRKANERGNVKFNWLDAYHTFSFGSYYDPAHMGFESLRVINEDFIDKGMGFDTHPHKNMEIITFMLKGQLAHKDSMGNISTIEPGEIQVMSAGTGVFHSEFNPSETNPTHSYQIWIQPNKFNVEPRYEQFSYLDKARKNQFTKLLSPNGCDDSVMIYQDVNLWYGDFEQGQELNVEGKGWLQVLEGQLEANGEVIETSDGLAFKNETVNIQTSKQCRLLWFEFLK